MFTNFGERLLFTFEEFLEHEEGERCRAEVALSAQHPPSKIEGCEGLLQSKGEG